MINLSAMALRSLCALLLAALTYASAAAEPSPSPSPTPNADPCGTPRTDLLAAIDRPTVGFSACAVKPNDVIAEFGYANQSSSGAGNADVYPQGFVRLGVAPNIEFDVIAPTGHLDSGAGLKYELHHNAGGAEAIDFLYTAPNGAPAYSAGSATETLNFDAGTTLGGTWSGGLTVGYQMGTVSSVLPSVVVAKQFSSSMQIYVEAFGATRIRQDGGWRVAYDAGIQRLLNERVEIDVEAGHAVTDRDRSQFVGFGMGLRF
jgi:hypothetical protein